MADIPVKVWDEKIVYQGRIIEVVEREMQIWDKRKTFEFARRSPGTRLIIVNDTHQMLITKEWRSELEAFDYRLPGGKVFDTLNEYNAALSNNSDITEKAKQGAALEAEQECGLAIQDPELFALSKCGATVVWDLYYFVVKKYTVLPTQSLEHGEHISCHRMSFDELEKICLGKEFSEDRSAAMIMKYLKNS